MKQGKGISITLFLVTTTRFSAPDRPFDADTSGLFRQKIPAVFFRESAPAAELPVARVNVQGPAVDA